MPQQTTNYNVAQYEQTNDEISLLDIALTLAKNKKIIFVVPLIVGLIVAIVSLFLPNIYTADTRILPPQQQQSSASALLGQLGVMNGLSSTAMGIKNPNDTYVAMLKSRTAQDILIQRFKLQQVYQEKSLEKTRQKLTTATKITAGKDGVIVIAVDDKNPKRAAALANGYVDALQIMTQIFAVTEASQRRLFYEKQLFQAKENLADAEVALKQLQEKTGVIQLDAQAELIITTAAELKGQIAMKEVELGAMRTFVTGNNPDYIRTQKTLAELRQQLAKVETGSVSTRQVPETGLDYIRRMRDVKYAETVYEMLAKQFEVAKLDEARESSVIQVMDKAIAPERQSKPRRSMIILIATITTAFIAILWAFLKEALVQAQQDETRKVQLERLVHQLRWK